MTNCINCGAVLKGDICEYCGTDYSRETVIDCGDKANAKITIGGKTYNAYLAECEINTLFTEPTRSIDGTLHRTPLKKIHRWKFIEY